MLGDGSSRSDHLEASGGSGVVELEQCVVKVPVAEYSQGYRLGIAALEGPELLQGIGGNPSAEYRHGNEDSILRGEGAGSDRTEQIDSFHRFSQSRGSEAGSFGSTAGGAEAEHSEFVEHG